MTIKKLDPRQIKTAYSDASIPADPAIGDFWIHTITGRRILYNHDGYAWRPIVEYGDISLYVDGAAGTDDLLHGIDAGSDAFATIQYAIDMLPSSLTGNVTIYIAAGVYAEDLAVQGKYFSGPYTLTLVGEESVVRASTSVKSALAGSRTTNGTININATLTTNQYKGTWIKFDDNTSTTELQGKKFLVHKNNNASNNSQMEVVGAWSVGFTVTPSTLDTFTIVGSGVQISSILVRGGQQSVVFDTVEVDTILLDEGSSTTFRYSKFRSASSNVVLLVDRKSSAYLYCCYGGAAVNARILFAKNNSLLQIPLCFLDGTNITTLYCVDVAGSTLAIDSMSFVVANNSATGILVRGAGASFGGWTTTNITRPTIYNCNLALYVTTGGQASYSLSSFVTYSGNTSDTDADASSFGYIS